MREPKRTAIEGLIVAGVGVAIALTANAMNPSGLKLGRDYFMMGSGSSATNSTRAASKHAATSQSDAATAGPGGQSQPHGSDLQTGQTAGVNSSTQPAETNGSGAAPAPAAPDDPYQGLSKETRAKLEHFNVDPIRLASLEKLFDSPLYAAGLYAIIDARDARDYAAGHLPGAHHLYYYEQEQYVPQVLPFAQGAEKVIVYCNGGDCEDSVLTAVLLRDQYFIDPSRIFVFPEGFEGWKNVGLPLERGARNSGDIVTSQTATGGGQ